ncbi:hypothetical protein M3Y97_00918800 [Aphelenchoides bicaudatus]|nr:hypothetical protein M3Y97_00918800 [Aphelenchoides bicaudatus]
MDSPVRSREVPNEENEQVTPKKQLTPVQNAVTLRLKKLMSERQIKYSMDTSKEIDLNDENIEPEVKVSPERQQRDDSLREWFRKRTPKASPANKKKQLTILKEELLERMKAQRHEEQESRQRVFKADNEICDEEEEFNESENESDADNEDSGSEGEIEEDEEIPESQKVAFDDEENVKDEEESVDNHSLDSTSNDENTNDTSNQSERTEQTDKSNTPIPNEDQSNFAFTDKTSNSYNLSPFMQDNDHADQPINKPTNFANLHLGINPIHHTTSISLHKTSSTPRIGSGYLLNEVPDSQSLDSQTLANEMQHLIEEQQQNAITERDNYDMLLNLTKFKADAKKEGSSESISSKEDDDLETDVFKKATKRKLQIESDDESDNESGKILPTTPSSGVTKLAKLNDDLFQIDDGDDRLDMEHAKPFVETVRVLFDDDDEESNESLPEITSQQVEEESFEDEEFEDLDESVALQRAKA